MEILINNQTHLIDKNSTLFQILDQIGIMQLKGIAVALNNEVCPKENWHNIHLEPNAHITIIKASQGG
jgi:sulfur carrier protein